MSLPCLNERNDLFATDHKSVKLFIIYYGTVQKGENYGPKLKTVLSNRPFFYLMIVVAIMTITHFTTITVITLADITGKEAVIAASVIVPTLTVTLSIIRIGTNMEYLQADMGDEMKATNFGAGGSKIPCNALKIVFAVLSLLLAIVQLATID